MRHLTFIIVFLFILFGCREKSKYPYRIVDFRPELQKNLNRINYFSKENNPFLNPFYPDSCTELELTKLLNCDNPYIRINAFYALIEKKDTSTFNHLLKHLDDTARIEWQLTDDVFGNEFIADIMLKETAPRLSQKQKERIVNEVLNNHIYLRSAQWIMMEIKPQEIYYSIIKKQCQTQSPDYHHLSITYALAKFQKQEDIPIIRGNFSNFDNHKYLSNPYLFRAIEVFPDTSFFSLLTKYFDEVIKKKKHKGLDLKDDLKYYCRAVAKYKNQVGLNILIALTKEETYSDSTYYIKDNRESVFKAIHMYSSPIYDKLYKELKPQMSDFAMKYLDKPEYEESTTW